LIFKCLFNIKAQNNLIIVSANGKPFFLFVNNKKVNDSLQSLVKCEKIISDTCLVQIKYTTSNNFELSEKVLLLQNGKHCQDIDFTYAIETLKGKNTIKFISTNNTYSDTLSKHRNISRLVEKYKTDIEKQLEYNDRVAEKYPSPQECSKNISDSLLEIQVNVLKENHIKINRMKDAKWFITHNCLNISQFEKVLLTFDDERSKETLAEFGYDYVTDKNNFLNLTRAFNFRSEQEQLKMFYNKKIK
jgi:hypothetical protein